MDGLMYFMPWSGNGGDFYGHPGLMNLLYYLWSEVFGNTISSARHFVLTSSCLTLLSIYAVVCRSFGVFVGFCTALSFFLLPLFQIESIIFMQLLGSFAPALFALYFYKSERLFFYCLLATAGLLWLESAIAIPLAILFFELKEKKQWKWRDISRLAFLIAPVLSMALFFLVRSQTGMIEKHVTQDLVIRRLFNPLLIISENNWHELAENRWTTLAENLPMGFVFIFVMTLGWALTQKKIPKLETTGRVLGLAFVLQLAFYSLYSEHPGGGDFYLGFIFLFMMFFIVMNTLSLGRILSLGVIVLIGSNTLVQLHKIEYGMSPVTIYEYTRHAEYSQLKKKIEAIPGGPYGCFQQEFEFQVVFCHPFFNLVPGNIEPVTQMEESDIVILDNQDPMAWEELYSHAMAPTGRSEYIGEFRDADLSILWIESFAD